MEKAALEPRYTNFRRDWLDSLIKNGFALDEGLFTRSSGGKVAYVLIQKDPQAKLTILFHGTGNDQIFTWQPLILELLRSGRNVLSFDLDGHGTASTTILRKQDFAESTVDLSAFLDAQGLSSRPYDLIGYSLGALLIVLAVSRRILQPEKLVLIALPLQIQVNQRFVWRELMSLISPEFYRQWRRYGWRETLPAVGNFRRRAFPLRLDPQFKGSYLKMVDGIFRDFPPLAMAPELGHNCLVLFGENDVLASPCQLKHWQIAAPKAKLVVIDRANHFLLPFQRQTLETIKAWIES